MKPAARPQLPILEGLALDLCVKSMAAELTTSEIKLATWLVAAAYWTGGFPVEFSMREIKEGCKRGDVTLNGWGAHYRTIGSAIGGLEEKQIIEVADGTKRRFGHLSRVFTPTASVLRG